MVGNEEKEEEMKRIFIILIALTATLYSTAQEKNKRCSFNYGVSFSVNAPFVNERKMFVDWQEVDKPYDETKIAGSISLFGRLNINRNYIQLEVGNSFIRDESTFNTESFGATTNNFIKADNFAITLDVPLLYGYNFIKRDKYELSLFGGPKMRYTYLNREDIENSGTTALIIKEDIHPISACCIVGMEAKISRLFIDFRYEFGITVHNKPGTYMLYENDVLTSKGTLYAKRSINLLSFSLGVIL